MEVFRLTAEASLLMGPRYIAVALWVLIAKGKGKIVADVPKLMETIFPGEKRDVSEFRGWLGELQKNGVIDWYKDGEVWMIRTGKGGFALTREPKASKKQIGSKVVMVFPTNGDIKEWSLTEAEVERFAKRFPAIDVMQVFRSALNYIECNPTERKTAKGMLRFLGKQFDFAVNYGKYRKEAGSFGASREEKPRGALGRALAEFGSN